MAASVAAQPADRIDPQPTWPSVEPPFDSAAEAFASGNYALALHMAPTGSALRAAALVMCGAVAPGLAQLAGFDSPEMRLIRAYAHWCLDQSAEALTQLAGLSGSELAVEAAALADLVGGVPEVVLVTTPGSSHAGRYQLLESIRVHSIQLGPSAFDTTMKDALDALPPGARPAMILSIDAYGPYLPRAPKAPGLPLVVWAGDHDFYFALRYADLARADVIAVNSAAEQVEMARHYGARIATFPGHESYLQPRRTGARAPHDTDIVYTGRAFTPYMRDKAQLLFRLATLDDPALSIEIVDGYLAEAEYAAALARARHVPLFWRYAGGLQTRGIEALRAGACVLVPEAGIARPLLGAAEPAFRSLVEREPAAILGEPLPRGEAISADLDHLFWTSPAREARFVKFCLFQTIVSRRRIAAAPEPSYTPAELRSYSAAEGMQAYTRIARLNAEAEAPEAAAFSHAAAAAFYAAILVPGSETIAGRALDFYRGGVAAFPRSLALRFNAARALWTFGLRSEAVAAFQAIVEQLPDLSFDARTDPLLSHRVRALAEMFPYGDFYRAAVAAPDPKARAPGPREFVASAALAYIAADLIARGQPAAALPLLQRAVERCELNVAAWRLLAQALSAAGAAPARTRAAFYRAVNLYPAELLNLLPVGLEAELGDGRTAAAGRMLRQWVLVRTRVRDAKGQPAPASDEAVAAARRYRVLLTDWTGPLLDRMVSSG